MNHPAAPASSTLPGQGHAQRRLERLRVALAPLTQSLHGSPRSSIAILTLSTIVSTLAFAHGDLHWTVNNSFAYLEGHFRDFYDYNLNTSGEADYFPTIYAIFAVWMIPVKLLGGSSHPGGALSPGATLWAKLLIVSVFLLTVWLLAKLAEIILPDRRARQIAVLSYLLSPFAAYAALSFGQYDVFGIAFTLLGLIFYFRGQKWHFAVAFALAISCKYFALAVFLPLLLLRYKKPRDIIALLAVGASVGFFETLPYIHSPAFRHYTVLGLVHATGGTLSDGLTITTLVGILVIATCILLWRWRVPEEHLPHVAIFACSLFYGMIFLVLAWHPQWFILLTPFFALAVAMLRRPFRFLMWESTAFIFFTWLIVNVAPNNVDNALTVNGALRVWLGSPHLLMNSLYVVPPHAMLLLYGAIGFFVISPAIFLAFEAVSPGLDADEPHPRFEASAWVARSLTFPVVFLIPALVATLFPLNSARQLDAAAGTYDVAHASLCDRMEVPYAELHDGVEARQTFSIESVRAISGVSVVVGEYGRRPPGTLFLTLVAADGGQVARQEIRLATVKDNGLAVIHLPPHFEKPGQYTLVASTSGVRQGSGVALWGSSGDCFGPGGLTFGGEQKPGDLNVSLFSAKN